MIGHIWIRRYTRRPSVLDNAQKRCIVIFIEYDFTRPDHTEARFLFPGTPRA